MLQQKVAVGEVKIEIEEEEAEKKKVRGISEKKNYKYPSLLNLSEGSKGPH